ncbi:hypothetical protein SAMN05216593_102195 [Pseudomonas asturiensis]|uniref:Uncharacterized protein n=1 Tax=Pseudomonas asturiensis TaxID=1190415 RepID=A0A1M7KKL0_9PSED|nr:hypothetical protein [Pseudomonas asturiensis]SHM65676.1 hypothetical protein SAMN05216593_102195 [Pseudomonas asturiensis]
MKTIKWVDDAVLVVEVDEGVYSLAQMRGQGPDAGDRALPLFEGAMLHINQFEDGIETVERESLMEVLYQLGEKVGLSRDTEFLERWRGDW